MRADYVIVGAGSAGSALAFRLAEAGRRVIVIEQGGSDRGPLIRMPGALSYPMNMPRYDWGFISEPEPGLGGRRLATPRGKVLGGSSSINGMVYVRGHPRDFDHWAESGAQGWAFADVAPYFRRLECWHGGNDAEWGRPDPAWRGLSGPVHVTRGARANPLFGAFVRAAVEAGYAASADLNGARQEGFGALEATIWRGERWSAARAYLRPALATGNCRLVRGLARRVVIEEGRARAVEIARHGRTERISAAAEVILSASAINSPKLLMLSGIGPAAHLAAHGIPVLADRPGVGGNLQDHLEVYVQFAARRPVTLYRYWNLAGKAWVGLMWLLARRGPGASNQFETGGFIRSRAGVEYPDIQFHFLPIAVRYDGRAAAEGHGFQVHVGPMRSESRGEVRLSGPDPAAPPVIRFNYMSAPGDRAEFRAAIRLAREIFAQPAMAAHVRHEILPGPGVQTDAEIDAFVRDHAESAYHPCGTCRMGRPDDPLAVVDPDCRVIGVAGLRVVDSSIFPRITNGNLNAPSLMTGEKAADHVLGRRLPRAEALVPWIHPDWRTRQR
ncbi:MAG: choline dehydrogenase [Alphaproteobacteria bacterium]|nr:MAG: choline dehydrogenase [Alphaproteobacteria bacterium]